MKFAKQLQDDQDVEWTEQYLDYKRMKKVLKRDEGDELVVTFMESLEAELCKVREFMLGFEESLLKDVQPFDANDVMATDKCEEMVQNIVRFRNFAALNCEGLRKILKKFRKSVDAEQLALLPDDPFSEQICSADDIDLWLLGPAQHCHELLVVPDKDRLSPATARQVNFWLEELRVGLLLAAQRNTGPAILLPAPSFSPAHLLTTALRLQFWGDRADMHSSQFCIKNGFIDAPMAPESELASKTRQRRASSVPVNSSRSRKESGDAFADDVDQSSSPGSSPKASRRPSGLASSLISSPQASCAFGLRQALPAPEAQAPSSLTNELARIEPDAALPISADVPGPCKVPEPQPSEASMTPRRVDLPLSYQLWRGSAPGVCKGSAGELLRLQARPSLPVDADAAVAAHHPLEPREVVVIDPSLESHGAASVGKFFQGDDVPGSGSAKRGRRGDLRHLSGCLQPPAPPADWRAAPGWIPAATSQAPLPAAPGAPLGQGCVGPVMPPGVWGSPCSAFGSRAAPGFGEGPPSGSPVEPVFANVPQDPLGRPPGRPHSGQPGAPPCTSQSMGRRTPLQQIAPQQFSPQPAYSRPATAPPTSEQRPPCSVGRWWTKVDGELMCPLSDFPIQMLPYPPFKYQVCPGKDSARLVDGGFLAIKVLATLDFEVLGRPLNLQDVIALDGYVKRCKLGPWRVAKALELRTKGTSASLQELTVLQDQARRKFKKLKHIKQTRLQSAVQPQGATAG